MKRLVWLSPLTLLLLAQQPSASRLTVDLVRALQVRNLPGTLSSGRISDVAVDPRNRSVWYVATSSGGLWKTTNRGLTFQPIFDEGGAYSLGCVTVDPKNPDVVWLGTGENQAQRAIGWGDGVYKSTDGGKTWKNVGLRRSEHIAKILVDPRDSNVVLVASQGPLFSAGGDRGLFKTTDGGQTWTPILEISGDTGVTDVAVDPRNPDVMYAASYQRRRVTSIVIAGGPESALYKTTDGGAHWNKLTDGIPAVDLGRIALAISPQKPDVVYATITTSVKEHKSGFYRSDDAGAHWRMAGNYFVVQDPEYYGEIFADPFQYDRVYLMDMVVRITDDGGKTIRPSGWQVHPDNHSLTFDPSDPEHLLVGNDGGLYESYDHGRSWRHFNGLPVTQFYRVSVDNAEPYNLYGGTQDNGSQGVPSRTSNRAGIRSSDWMNTLGADGFQSRADWQDPNTVYACSQNIGCSRVDMRTGAAVSIRPRFEGPDNEGLRSRWDIPFIISPHSHTRLYIAGNRLMRSDDRGATWKLVSPDLTRNIDRNTIPVMGNLWPDDTAVWKNAFTDLYGTGTAVAESPVKEGLLFVGTDDGTVAISENGGGEWRRVEKFPGVPDLTYVTDIFPSPHDANTVFVTFNDFQRGNFKPYVLKSSDLGKTWTSIASDLPGHDPVWTLVQDHLNPSLLFIGTEFGLSFTADGGRHWVAMKGGMPVIPIRDLEIQKRESDLAMASFGRGFFVLDDYAPLRRMDDETLASEAVLFAPGRKARIVEENTLYRAQGDNFAAPNPPVGALLTYYLRENQRDTKIVLTVTDASGKQVRQLDAVGQPGLHRTPWDLRETAPAPPAGGRGGRGGFGIPRGALVKPGTYTVTLGRLVNGVLTPLGKPQAVEVI